MSEKEEIKKEILDYFVDKLTKNPYSNYKINYDNNQIIFYYNDKDNALLTLIEASSFSVKIIYEKVYTHRLQYKLTIII